MADLLYPKRRSKKPRKKHTPSIIQPRDGGCYLCEKLHGDYSAKRTEEHHVYVGPGQRDISEAWGFKVYLCRRHHIHAGRPERRPWKNLTITNTGKQSDRQRK